MDKLSLVVDRPQSPSADIYPFRRDEKIEALLSLIGERIKAGDAIGGMQALIDNLREIRLNAGADEWRRISAEVVLKHPVAEILFQCPLTRRSNEKPRGYAGDAELLDHIYGLGSASLAPHPATTAGQIYFYTVNSPACRAVRRRREILAREIDVAADRLGGEKPSILSIACGHLREASLSRAVQSGGVDRFIALDQDEESLAEVERAYSGFGVEATKGTVRAIIARKAVYRDLDFVYAAGLYDYLSEPIGMRLVERMFEFLRPGGRLLIANFTPAVADVGYMETFMDWWLILRTKDQVRGLLNTLPANQVGQIDVFEDEAGTIAYATAEKRA